MTAGGAQWMSAGRGIVHSERPLADGEGETIQHGIQLWTSLPRALKMMPPRYRRIDAAQIAEARLPAGTLRVVAGDGRRRDRPRRDADARLPRARHGASPAQALELDVAACHEAAAYVIEGEGRFGAEGEVPAGAGELVVFADGGGEVSLHERGQRAARP